jgi:radical SAM protein with 4Fe4S-binding SPASM domain
MATVILKVTEKCNARCYYCDVVRKPGTGHTMSRDVLEQLFVRAGEYLRDHPGESLNVLWHGGEPLLVGPDYFDLAAEFQTRYCPDGGKRLRHSIQTNLTAFKREFIAPFRRLGIGAVGTSYDPAPNIRGLGRRCDSDLYNRRFLRALRLLEENGIGYGLIYVVTKRSLERPIEVFHFLANLVPSGGFNMNPVLIYDEDRRDIAVTPAEYVDFLGAIFPGWWKTRERYPNVEPFKSLVDTIIHDRVSLGCVDSGRCTYHHINVAPDGDTSQCGRSADWGLLSYGNLRDRTLDEILANAQRDELAARVAHLRESECRGCRFWGLCHGGCPLDAWSRHKSFMHKTEWCEARRGFIERHFEPVTGSRYLTPASEEPVAVPA